MAAYVIRVTDPDHGTHTRPVQKGAGAITAAECARSATVGNNARAVVLKDGAVTATYEHGKRIKEGTC